MVIKPHFDIYHGDELIMKGTERVQIQKKTGLYKIVGNFFPTFVKALQWFYGVYVFMVSLV